MNPCSKSSAQPENLTLREEEELYEMQSDYTLKKKFTNLSLEMFWVSVKEAYPAIHRKAINILLQFVTSYMREQISCLICIKSQDRNLLISVQDELCVCLSKVRPIIKHLCSKMQTSVSR
jgi:hypothetical protein